MEKAEFIISAKDEATKVFQGVTDMLGGAMTLAAGAAAAGLGALGAGFAVAVKEAMDAQSNMADLNATLNATGRANLKQPILEMAQSLKDLAGGSDDAVIATANMLAGFKNIGDETMPRATKAALDLAAKLKITGNAAADMLGPILATGDRMNALKKANITFTDEQEKAIKALYEAGDAAGAQDMILKQLEATIGGTAAASAATFSGQLEIMKGHLLDAAEGIGTALLPIMQKLFDSVISPAIPVVEDLAKSFGESITYLSSFADGTRDIAAAIEEFGGPLGFISQAFGEFLPEGSSDKIYEFEKSIQPLYESMAEIVDGAKILVTWISENLPTAIETANSSWNSFISYIQPVIDGVMNVVSAIQSQIPAAVETLSTLWQFVSKYLGPDFEQIMNNIAGYVTQMKDNTGSSLKALGDFWREWGDEIMTVVGVVIGVVAVTLVEAITLATGIITATIQLLSGNWSGAWDTMKSTLESFLNTALALVGTNMEEFTNTWQGVWDNLKLIVSTYTMKITSGIQDWLINLINSLRSFLPMALQFGIDFANNIMLGVLQMAGQIAQVAYNVVSEAVKAAAAALGGAAAATAGAAGAGTAGHPYGGAHAGGGSTMAGRSYLVGEKGPELFTSSQSGRIVPNNALGTSIGNLSINIDGAGDPQAVADAVIRELRMRDLIPATSL